jgi:hypothetical protein
MGTFFPAEDTGSQGSPSTSVSSNTSEKCSAVPVSLEAIIGMVITHQFCLQNKSLSHMLE